MNSSLVLFITKHAEDYLMSPIPVNKAFFIVRIEDSGYGLLSSY